MRTESCCGIRGLSRICNRASRCRICAPRWGWIIWLVLMLLSPGLNEERCLSPAQGAVALAADTCLWGSAGHLKQVMHGTCRSGLWSGSSVLDTSGEVEDPKDAVHAAERSPASPVGHTHTTTVLSNGETEAQKGFRDSHSATLGLGIGLYNGWLLSQRDL